MTTIAYRAGILSFDTRITADGSIIGGSVKGRKTKKFLIAAAGSCDDCDAWLDWMEAGGVLDDRKKYGLDRDCDMWAIAVDKKGRIFNYTAKCYPWEVDAEYYAIGSGAHYAIGAMAMGASSAQAVKVAAKFDSATGGKVVSLGF